MIKKSFLLLFFFFCAQKVISQSKEQLSPVQKKLYDFETIQVKPEFNGGTNKFVEYVLKDFKKTKTGKNFKGPISLSFIVEMDGSISNIIIVNDLEIRTKQDLKEVFLKSPKWLCGEHDGYHVRTKVNFNFDVP